MKKKSTKRDPGNRKVEMHISLKNSTNPNMFPKQWKSIKSQKRFLLPLFIKTLPKVRPNTKLREKSLTVKTMKHRRKFKLRKPQNLKLRGKSLKMMANEK